MTDKDALAVEHEIQRQMLERLGIAWIPGEPFYALVEAEVERLRQEREAMTEGFIKKDRENDDLRAEVERLQTENRGLSETIAEWQEIHGTFTQQEEKSLL